MPERDCPLSLAEDRVELLIGHLLAGVQSRRASQDIDIAHGDWKSSLRATSKPLN
jgi:hypothetical protein